MGTLRDWSQSRKVTQFWLFVVQIGTKQNCSLTQAQQRSHRHAGIFNRTVVKSNTKILEKFHTLFIRKNSTSSELLVENF